MTRLSPFLSIDQNTDHLFSLFDSNQYKFEDVDILKQKISKLNEYQFFTFFTFLLNSKNIIINDEILSLFIIKNNTDFKIFNDDLPYEDSFKENSKNKKTDEPKLNDFSKTKIILNFQGELFNLLKNILTHLNKESIVPSQIIIDSVDIINDIVKLEIERDKVLNSLYDFHFNCDNQSNLINDISSHLVNFDKELLQYFDSIKSNVNKNIESFKKINFNFEERPLNFEFITIFPLIYSVDQWKNLVSKRIKESSNEVEFFSKKDFFKECLLKYQTLSKKDYVAQIKNYEVNDYIQISDMLTWIEETFVDPKEIENNKKKLSENYNIIVNKKILNKLYNELKRYSFINENKTSQKDFMNVLLLDWVDHKSTIFLEMNNPQTQLFFNSLNESLGIKIPLTQIEFSQKIENKNGLIKANSIYASTSKSKNTSIFPKQGDLLIEIIKSAKKG